MSVGDGLSTPGNQRDRSTRKQSKHRRDSITAEINELREYLPFPAATRSRLSQLQSMACAAVYLRKNAHLSEVFLGSNSTPSDFIWHGSAPEDFEHAMPGTLLVCTTSGHLLYIGRNASQTFGYNNIEDVLTQGDNVLDIVDKRDTAAVKSMLALGPASSSSLDSSSPPLLIRIQPHRTAKKSLQSQLSQKVVYMTGHFRTLPRLMVQRTTTDETVAPNPPPTIFLALCKPVLTSEDQGFPICSAGGPGRFFKTLHDLNMRITSTTLPLFLDLRSADGEVGASWYRLIHGDDLQAARSIHALVCKSDGPVNGLTLLRMRTPRGWMWCHASLRLLRNPKPMEPQPNPNDHCFMASIPDTLQPSPVNPCFEQQILVTYQILTADEIPIYRKASWLYQQPVPIVKPRAFNSGPITFRGSKDPDVIVEAEGYPVVAGRNIKKSQHARALPVTTPHPTLQERKKQCARPDVIPRKHHALDEELKVCRTSASGWHKGKNPARTSSAKTETVNRMFSEGSGICLAGKSISTASAPFYMNGESSRGEHEEQLVPDYFHKAVTIPSCGGGSLRGSEMVGSGSLRWPEVTGSGPLSYNISRPVTSFPKSAYEDDFYRHFLHSLAASSVAQSQP
ncbi:putative Neuronal PAS domain-containing protein 4 [Hypsibius exemplaris]|uniref:Neuronal PAS domain-containing protein 4 n=1 Tax=Hypsibius exemplaris TaxID=2072580 RepID=A0A1W0X2L2_HYPEX|nr:putative Neuronal PAS domain-containing protein 4 [Hypsibius exemplaris]